MQSSIRRFPNPKTNIRPDLEKDEKIIHKRVEMKRKLKFKKEYIEKLGLEAWIKNYGKEYKYLEGASLEEVVWALMKLRRQNKKDYYAIWEYHYLYSYNVTYDHAFREVYGISRTTYLNRLKEERNRLNALKSQEETKLKLKK